MPSFYIVATPIGNLGDITFRAIDILKSVDSIVCEDTRVTKKLLNHYNISKPAISYHSKSGLGKVDIILEMLKEGNNLALVSDAGTPTVSDPGSFLISKVREELGDSVKIIPIPGPSALTSALSASGLTDSGFLFLGFLPHKKGRETLFKEIQNSDRVVVFYESPHRFIKTLEKLAQILPDSRGLVVARELTKIYEEFKIGTSKEVLDFYKDNSDKVRGEFVILVDKN